MTASPALLKALQNLGNKYPHVRSQAVTAITSALGEHAGQGHEEEVRIAVRCVADHVRDADELTAVRSCSCLAAIGPLALVALPDLARACLDKRQPVCMEAIKALVKLVKLNAASRRKILEVMPTVVHGLMDVHADAVSQLAAVIRSLGDEASPIILLLVEEYLQVEPKGAVARLREKFTGHCHKRRERCFDLLGKIGPPAAPAVPVLKELHHSEDPWLQQQAKSCIIRIRRAADGT